MQDQDHQPELIRQVLTRYEAALLRYANSLTGNLDTAREVVQETLLRLCAADTPPLDGQLAPWLFTVCRHRALDVRRKETRMTIIDSPCEISISQLPEPVAHIEQHEESSRMLSALALLPDNLQEVVRLRFQGGLSYKEIAQVTEQSISNVGYLMHTAIRKLRDALL
ncbi:MAG: ECF RNA polymerase sigma factor SigL [Phycisphaerae bacterium]|nr:ECF RNA polymerase sigma factor SigL [Phycisphaerae bacterium]